MRPGRLQGPAGQLPVPGGRQAERRQGQPGQRSVELPEVHVAAEDIDQLAQVARLR
jgi:hypothetical protein